MSAGKSSGSAKRPMRSLTAHEKLEAIRRVHEGESKASVARDIGVPESTLRGWCKNEDKISYLSRQSSPESSEDADHKDKRLKMEEPYNLSLKANYPDLTKSEMEAAKTIADLSMKVEPQKASNRAELAKLSVELGLNRQEFFTPTTSASSNSVEIANSLLVQWNNMLLQQQLLQQKPTSTHKKVTAPADTSTNVEQKPLLPKPEKTPTVEDSVWYWLKTQQAMMMANQPPTTTAAPIIPPIPDNASNAWFWKWYKQFTEGQTAPDKPILYQQLMKSRDVENIEQPSNKSTTTKARAVLDNLLFNNNNNVPVPAKKEELSEVEEALEHGEKFLKWMETCGEPSVTTVQIMQFKTLLNNVRTGAERKNGEVQNKTKVKRK